MALTAAQVWYVAIVYPERVSASEASDAYDNFAMTEADRSYWQTAANVLNELSLLEPPAK